MKEESKGERGEGKSTENYTGKSTENYTEKSMVVFFFLTLIHMEEFMILKETVLSLIQDGDYYGDFIIMLKRRLIDGTTFRCSSFRSLALKTHS